MKFLMGLFLGFGVGLLVAPASGEETRRNLAENLNDLSEVPVRKMREAAEAAQEKAGEIGANVGRKVAEAAVEALREGALPADQKRPA